MRGGLERWKRGVDSQGVRQAMAYAFKGSCDSHLRMATGADALADYSAVDAAHVTRFTVQDGTIVTDPLDAEGLRRWVDGHDPLTNDPRGRELRSPNADLILDGTINAPKSYSIAALINADLAAEFEALQDRLRTRIIMTWQRELNARRGAGGCIRESLQQIEVVELRHRRSRALDPHVHRHLWLNVKVLGQDGKWSNVDSRVAMKLHTLINAEGELAARTDPEWIAALARNGYTLGDHGEIAQLTHAVRPLSRRSNQIEANRAKLLLDWRQAHPGQHPNHDVLQHIDRLAWAKNRPNKAGVVDESEWAELICDELRAIDADILSTRPAVRHSAVAIADIDRELLAARAIVDADTRSTACGGRFSSYDVRAGATRAVAASGVAARREDLQELIDDVLARSLAHTVDLLEEGEERPKHIKAFMASSTAGLKIELAARFDAITCAGVSLRRSTILDIADRVLDSELSLDEAQAAAAAAIGGTDRLVAVTGPAGAGKTTMLRVARLALELQRRQLVVVAPTKKAASVAGREIGAPASSLHALLADHGWRWSRNEAGAEVWSRLEVGEIDPHTGRVYAGPRRFNLRRGDRVVVDEAGMVDLHTANALATIAAESGAGIAMVGDHLQAMPVGHAGAMACMTRRATAVVELTAVHRFRDPSYAALTLRMREPASKDHALAVAVDLDQRGHIHRVTDAAHARDVMVEAYFRWAASRKRVALVTSTNDEADAINEAIQERRIELGQLSQVRLAVGQGEQRLLEGDVVQTRLNDRATDVENRALWTIRRIGTDALALVALGDSGDVRRVSLDYAAEHVHLAYASTVHGIQGETTDASIVGPAVDASGLYVGMTRGRLHNEAIAIARTPDAAREQIADSMMRGVVEVTIEDSMRAARRELGRAARVTLDRVTENLASMDSALRAIRKTLRDLDAHLASEEARVHGRAAWTAEHDRVVGLRDSLATRYMSDVSRYKDLMRRWEAADVAPGAARGRLAAAAPIIESESDRGAMIRP
ncbi:AAA family ATPase [Microbacterium sp. CPCC 204701]|uniref:AAA family ATPase n=1 Tax=Microbacterium sp. CPCC 204701 TaxID=2493084 RepID=UPI001F0BF573|nr:AAA family ATPase [Microbacterium sp. CPCC 204701]